MPERRRSKRVPARVKVWCEGDDFTLLAETINVSHHGMFVRSSSLPPASGAFRVSIEDLGTVAEVEVCWVRGTREPGRGGLGLRIVGFTRGADAYQRFVDASRTPSGEFRVSWPLPAPGTEDDEEEP